VNRGRQEKEPYFLSPDTYSNIDKIHLIHQNGFIMVSITIKNIPDMIYSAVKKRAKKNHRSINGEILHILEEVTAPVPVTPEESLEQARRYRRMTAGSPVTAREIQKAKEFGRK
jgi:plasmid stability protein